MALIKFFKVTSLPATLEANAFYYVKESGNAVSGWLTDNAGTAYAINNADTVVNSVNGLNGNVTLDLSFSGGQLGITGRDGNKVNLDIRYMKIGDHISWGYIDGKPTTVSGYGINDVYTKSQTDAITGLLTNLNTSNKNNLVAAINELNGALADQLQVPEAIDCSANPDYPASVKGDTYKVTVAGKIGGADGLDVNAGDMIICTVTNAGGDQETAGSNFFIVESNLADASTTVKGIGRIATLEEVDAGNEAKAWVTPLTLSSIYYTKTQSDGRYLQSESDPVFNASPAGTITTDDINTWNTALQPSALSTEFTYDDATPLISINSIVASKITDDATHRFVTDTEITTWNNKAELSDIKDGQLTISTTSDLTGSGTFTANQDTSSSISIGLASSIKSLITGAIQPGDNISDLTNDAGYITNADIPVTPTLQQVTEAGNQTNKYSLFTNSIGVGRRTITSSASTGTFTDGILIKTDIAVNQTVAFYLDISGGGNNAYINKLFISGYRIGNDSVIYRLNALSFSSEFSTVSAIILNDFLCFWVSGSYTTTAFAPEVQLYTSFNDNNFKITSITNSSKPSDLTVDLTVDVELLSTHSWSTANFLSTVDTDIIANPISTDLNTLGNFFGFVNASSTNLPISTGGMILSNAIDEGHPRVQLYIANSGTMFTRGGGSSAISDTWLTIADRGWVQSQNYLTTETDPIFTSSVAHSITSADITNWNAALQSGDKISELDNDAGYLTSFTETDPTVSLFTKNLTDNSSVLTAVKAVDGAGSELDADLLDGKQGSYYLDYNNLTNTPTIPDEYELPIATSSILGGIKVGTRLSITAQGTLSADNQMVWASTDW